MAGITHHRQRLPKPTAGPAEAHPGGAARTLGSSGLRAGAGDHSRWDPGGIQVGSRLCLLPMAILATLLATKPRAGMQQQRRVGATNSFPFMICYDDTPEG